MGISADEFLKIIKVTIRIFIIFKQSMMLDEQRMLSELEPLIKIIKQQQSMYFQALGFVNKNIESSSNQIDQISLFTKFISISAEKQSGAQEKEHQLLKKLSSNQQQNTEGYKISNTSKQMMRLSARIMQILQTSIDKTRHSLFNENGKSSIDFARFKKSLHKIIQQNPIQLAQFVKLIVNFSKNKYRRQITRIKKYLQKLKDGENISFKDMYAKDGSDASVSPDQKYKKQTKFVAKPSVKIFKQTQHQQNQSPTKKSSLKRPDASKSKRGTSLKGSKKQKQAGNIKLNDQKQYKMQKSATAALLLRHYSIMELHKKQFLQDYVFEKHQQQKQRKRLITQLMERNKTNMEQIKQFSIKCQSFNPAIHLIINPSSDENKSVNRNDSSVNSRASIRTSFVISKRKQSFTFESASDRSDIQANKIQTQIPFSRTIKNLSTKKRSSQQKPTKPTQKSKKIFVVKSPLNFDDDVIPKAQISQTGWMQIPLTGKQKTKKSQSLRMKKRNNPCPLDEKFLPESFRFSQHPI